MKKVFFLFAVLTGAAYFTYTASAQPNHNTQAGSDCVNRCINNVKACVTRLAPGVQTSFNAVYGGDVIYIEASSTGNNNILAQCISENNNCQGSGGCTQMPTLVQH
jgi:hypothetical protein